MMTYENMTEEQAGALDTVEVDGHLSRYNLSHVYVWQAIHDPNLFYGGQTTKSNLRQRHSSGTYAVNNQSYCIRGQHVKVIWSAKVIFRMSMAAYMSRGYTSPQSVSASFTRQSYGMFDWTGRDRFLSDQEQSVINAVHLLSKEYNEEGVTYCNRKNATHNNHVNMDAYFSIEQYLINQRLTMMDNMVKKMQEIRSCHQQPEFVNFN
ncbi:MAG: hypothetical protein CMI54_03905 [Parcubacteria group bacterium]|nr:hypothetical protein [Parcubacteria group bacterium]